MWQLKSETADLRVDSNFHPCQLPQLNGFSISGKTNCQILRIIEAGLKGYKSIFLDSYVIDLSANEVDYSIRFYDMKESKKERKSFSKKFNINVEALIGK